MSTYKAVILRCDECTTETKIDPDPRGLWPLPGWSSGIGNYDTCPGCSMDTPARADVGDDGEPERRG